ncbi:MAG TPA: SpoIID/LytB domain-containing protein [Streptomyces sp.]|nr:SpoIID/LytB domain-containing protein [Streptomyces sp.]
MLLLAVLGAGLLAVPGASPASASLEGAVEISGHGWGHGRGMSQYGALGYAVDRGWTWQQILDHYYGGTTFKAVGNPTISVELMSWGGRDLVATAPSLTVNGAAVGAAAVLIRRNANGTFSGYRGAGCSGPWTLFNGGLATGLTVASSASAADPANHVQVCESGQVRGYRGALQVVNTGTSSAVVNRVPLEDYLRGVVPREMPASWAALGGGRGANALRVQAVAARSYAISSPRSSYATTCDSTACQVYGGEYTRPLASSTRTSLEDPRSDAAISATAGLARADSAGRVSRTEFSSSSGGWTAGGTFPAVEDLGDATAGNPNHDWSVSIDAGVLAARLGTTVITGLSVTQRNGLGADGGRVLQVAVDTTSGRNTFTGNQFRSRVGLKSDWFSIDVTSYAESTAFVKALYSDLLGRTAQPVEVAPWAAAVAGGASPKAVATSFLSSEEHLRAVVADVYAQALRRRPEPSAYGPWVGYLRANSYTDLEAKIYGSAESIQALGGGDLRRWVEGMYQGVLGRHAAPAEEAFWAGEAARHGRAFATWHIAASVEARTKRLDGYYLNLLQRPADSSGLRTWLPFMLSNGDDSLQAAIAGSAEYWNKAGARFP